MAFWSFQSLKILMFGGFSRLSATLVDDVINKHLEQKGFWTVIVVTKIWNRKREKCIYTANLLFQRSAAWFPSSLKVKYKISYTKHERISVTSIYILYTFTNKQQEKSVIETV